MELSKKELIEKNKKLHRRAQKAESLLKKYKKLDANLHEQLEDIIESLQRSRQGLNGQWGQRRRRIWDYYKNYWLKGLAEEAIGEDFCSWDDIGNLIRKHLREYYNMNDVAKQEMLNMLKDK